MSQEIPRLAKLVGGYREMPPLDPLRSHFRCFWMQAIPPDHAGPIAVLPDGCADILWVGDRLEVVGPDLTAAHPALAPGAIVMGLRFQPGAASHWLGLPISEITGRQLDLEDLWAGRARDIGARIAGAATPSDAQARLQASLARMTPDIDPPDPEMATVFRCLSRSPGHSGATVRHLLGHLSVSERSLRRRCHVAFGYGPKTLERILRLQNFLTAARADPGTGLASLACMAGYADQAHLSREVRALSGFSPAMIRRQLHKGAD